MVRHIYSLFDLKAGAFLPPWSAPTQGIAYRQLADAVNGPPNAVDPIVSHPEDFELFDLGKFDEQTGVIYPCDKPNLVCRCSDLKIVV